MKKVSSGEEGEKKIKMVWGTMPCREPTNREMRGSGAGGREESEMGRDGLSSERLGRGGKTWPGGSSRRENSWLVFTLFHRV
ncbi:hypothetical protein HmCmsJML021_02699 [Escherichia coli]|nr:hypothetical protein HmCmsJML021_02699 [Escherichia coli]